MAKKKLEIKINSLTVKEEKNAFIVPTSSNEIESTFVGGVYMSNGQIIQDSKIKTIPTWTDKSPEFLKDVNIIDKFEGKSIYIGLTTTMFGHFFTDTAARLWYLLENTEYDRIVFVDPFLDILKVEPQTNELLKLIKMVFNLPSEKICIVKRLSEFEQLIIPDKTIFDEFNIHYTHLNIIEKIKEYCQAKHPDISSSWKEKIYIANTVTNRSSLQCKNESDIIELYKNLDYSIIDPKNVTLSEQIAALSNANTIATLTGANLYNIVFADERTDLIAIGNIKFKARNYGCIRAFNSLKHPNYYYIKFQGDAFTSDICTIDIDHLSEQMAFVINSIRYVKLHNFSKTDYYKALKKLNDLQGDENKYFEIGTNTGNSIKLAKGYCVGVDPRFVIEQDVSDNKKSIKFYQVPSDDFFEEYLEKAYAGKKIDLAFIDGLHHADQVFKDIINTEAIAHKDTIITVHDIIPIDNKSANRKRGPNLGAWTGDVWKAIYVLMKERKDLKFIFLDCPPSGLLLIFNPNNNWQEQNQQLYKEMTDRADHLDDEKLVEYLEMIELVDTDYFLKTFTLEGGYEGLIKKRPLELESN